jgi:hypothetical protein
MQLQTACPIRQYAIHYRYTGRSERGAHANPGVRDIKFLGGKTSKTQMKHRHI